MIEESYTKISKILNNKIKKTRNPLMDVMSSTDIKNIIQDIADLKSNSKILDIGGGRGAHYNFNKNHTYKILDLNDDGRANVVHGDITDVELNTDTKYDLVITKDTFEHILNPWDAVDNILNLLNEGGFFVCIVPFNWRFHSSPYDAYRFSHQGQKYLWEHKGRMKEVSSGYIYWHKALRGSWQNECDSWPFGNSYHHDCVSSFYVGQKNKNHKFNIKEIKADYSLRHEKKPQ